MKAPKLKIDQIVAAKSEYWFWATLVITAIALSMAWGLINQSIKVWNQPRAMKVQGEIKQLEVLERDYAVAAEVLRGRMPYDDQGKPVAVLTPSATGISIAAATPASFDDFISILWQVPGTLPNVTWEIDELCVGGSCQGGATVAHVRAKEISVAMTLK